MIYISIAYLYIIMIRDHNRGQTPFFVPGLQWENNLPGGLTPDRAP